MTNLPTRVSPALSSAQLQGFSCPSTLLELEELEEVVEATNRMRTREDIVRLSVHDDCIHQNTRLDLVDLLSQC